VQDVMAIVVTPLNSGNDAFLMQADDCRQMTTAWWMGLPI
jgi:hypothetical protein